MPGYSANRRRQEPAVGPERCRSAANSIASELNEAPRGFLLIAAQFNRHPSTAAMPNIPDDPLRRLIEETEGLLKAIGAA